MINNIANVDARLQMSAAKAQTSAFVSIPMPPVLSFKTPLLKEKATIRVKKLNRSDNLPVVGEIDDDYVDIVEEEVDVSEYQTSPHSFLKLPPQKFKRAYLKNCYIIDFIQSPTTRRGLGTAAIKQLAEKAMFDERAQGRIVTYAAPMMRESSPAQFFYKLGFRFFDPKANEYIAECLAKKIPDIPAQTGMMYLPKAQLHKLLRYGDLF